MDIKLKKYDGSLTKKAIVFVLAILVAAAAVVPASFALFKSFDEIGEASYIEDYFLKGANPKIYDHQAFYDNYDAFLGSVVEKTFLYGGKSSPSYEKYCSYKNAVTKSEKSKIKAFVISCLNSTELSLDDDEEWSTGSDEIYESYSNNLVSLELLEELDRESYVASIQESDVSFDSSMTDEKASMFDFFSDDPQSYSSVKTEIPDSVFEKAEASGADGVVKIMAVVDGKALFGYYGFKVDVEKAYSYCIKNNIISDYYTITSEEEYDKAVEAVENKLDEYKNVFFAFIDNNTGAVLSNADGINKNSTHDEIESTFLSDKGNGTFYGVFHNGHVDQSKCGEEFISNDKFLFTYEISSLPYTSGFSSFSDDYDIYVKFDETLSGGTDVFSTIEDNYKTVSSSMTKFVIIDLILLLVFVLLIVYLVIKSGKNETDDELHMLRGDGLFTDFKYYLNGGIIAGLVCLMLLFLMGITTFNHVMFVSVMIVFVLLIATLLIDLILYTARHIKKKDFLKNLFPVWLLLKIIGEIQENIQKNREAFTYLKDFRKAMLKKLLLMVALPNVLLIFITVAASDASLFAFLVMFGLFIYDVFVLIYMMKLISAVKTILVAINQIRSGNYNVYINIPDLPKELRVSAQSILQLRDGMKIAVDKAIADEKMRTELITNVSHDLKTPLTSIINYVDLLTRLDIQDETAKEYLGVIGEKSARLKRLIEDLVEASKASSGAITVNFMKVSLNELVSQLAGEYEDEFEAYGISAVENIPQESICVNADSKLIYRVVDNLLSNAKKYSLENTRVYIDVFRNENKGVIKIKNISREPLNISPEKLKERFVRGDESRSREGSGLGLSIAENLCNLQRGKLTLDINGDMFISTVEFELFVEPRQNTNFAPNQNPTSFDAQPQQPEQNQSTDDTL